MNNYKFLNIFYKNLDIYFLSLVIILLVYFFIFRKKIFSIIDPLFYAVLTSAFAGSIVVFLFFKNSITLHYFLQFIFTQILFFVGYFCFKSISIKDAKTYNTTRKAVKFKDEKLLTEIFFVVTSLVYMLIQVYIYYTRGIPLLMKSRLETFALGTGFGYLSRLITITSAVSGFMILHMLFNYKNNRIKYFLYFMIIIYTLTSILGGSKSAFLGIAYSFFCFAIFNIRINNYSESSYKLISILKKNEWKVVVLAFILVVAIIIIQTRDSKVEMNPIIRLGYRIIDYGNIFWYSYPSESYKVIDNSKPFVSLFADLLGALRIVPWEEQPLNSGLAVFRFHHPEFGSIIMGPNTRHNIFGLAYFGYWGSLVFSFFMGLILSFFRNLLYYKLPNNFFGGIVFSLFYINIIAVETDPMLAFTYINNIILVFPFLLIFTIIVYWLVLKKFNMQNVTTN